MSRPGSDNGAEIWDGLSRNPGDPMFDQPKIASGTGLERDQALVSPSGMVETPRLQAKERIV
jgi:hypothetical protein